jgi:hypothetical protein
MRFRMLGVVIAVGAACARGPSAFDQLGESIRTAQTKIDVSGVVGSLPTACAPTDDGGEMCEWRRPWGGGVGYVAQPGGGLAPVTIPVRQLVVLCRFRADGGREPNSCRTEVQ